MRSDHLSKHLKTHQAKKPNSDTLSKDTAESESDGNTSLSLTQATITMDLVGDGDLKPIVVKMDTL